MSKRPPTLEAANELMLRARGCRGDDDRFVLVNQAVALLAEPYPEFASSALMEAAAYAAEEGKRDLAISFCHRAKGLYRRYSAPWSTLALLEVENANECLATGERERAVLFYRRARRHHQIAAAVLDLEGLPAEAAVEREFAAFADVRRSAVARRER